MLWGAVRSALAVLGDRDGLSDRSGLGGADPTPPQPARIEQYLTAVLEACTAPHGQGAPVEVLAAVRSACVHLRVRELADAYLALHTAHGALRAVLGERLRPPR